VADGHAKVADRTINKLVCHPGGPIVRRVDGNAAQVEVGVALPHVDAVELLRIGAVCFVQDAVQDQPTIIVIGNRIEGSGPARNLRLTRLDLLAAGKSPRVSPGLATAGHGDAATLLLKGNVLAVGGSDNYAHPTVNAKTYA